MGIEYRTMINQIQKLCDFWHKDVVKSNPILGIISKEIYPY